MVRTIRVMNLGLVALAAASSFLALPRLPAVVATHWNAYGQADGFSPRTLAVLLVPALMLALLALFAVLPKVSPRGYTIESQRGVYEGVVLSTLVFLLVVHAMMIAVGLGYPVQIERVVPFAISVLFVALGACLGRVKMNFFMGIRTPWTLTSVENWEATHRFTGRLFVWGGLALAGACVAGASFWVVFAGFLALGLLPLAYSFAYWARE